MTDEAALIGACNTSPQEDTPRLVYADWLEEHRSDDDSARARVEWIRMTCGKVRKCRVTRLPGERDWLAANIYRLWPKLMGIGAVMDFRLGVIRFLVPVGKTKTKTVVMVRASRGICDQVEVRFTYASRVAPLAAADEPHAMIVFGLLPQFAYRHNLYGPVHAMRVGAIALMSGFDSRGLRGVWDDLEGWEMEASGSGAKFLDSTLHQEWKRTAPRMINAALTRWARKMAAVPHRPVLEWETPDESAGEDCPTIPERV